MVGSVSSLQVAPLLTARDISATPQTAVRGAVFAAMFGLPAPAPLNPEAFVLVPSSGTRLITLLEAVLPQVNCSSTSEPDAVLTGNGGTMAVESA